MLNAGAANPAMPTANAGPTPTVAAAATFVNPAFGGVLPQHQPTMSGDALHQGHPALSVSNPALLAAAHPAFGGAANPVLVGATNPALIGATNPALIGGGSNPALHASNPALVNPGFANQSAFADPSAQLHQHQQHVAAENGGMVLMMDANGQYVQQHSPHSPNSPHSPHSPHHHPAQDPSTPQQLQPMYDANGQIMYDANGQIIYQYQPEQPPPHTGDQMDPNNPSAHQQQGFGNDVFSAFPGDPQQNPALAGLGQNGGMMASSSNGMIGGGANGGLPVSTATTASAPSTPTHPKTFRVRLPADQRQVVPFKADVTLRSVLSKICGSRGLAMDDYLAKDRSGMDISLDKTLGEINQEEISFLTPRAGVVPQDETKRRAHKLMSDIYEANAGLSSSLQAIIKNYRDPLLKSAQDVDMRKRLLSEQECNQIFASLESITSLTKEFMSHLSAQLSTWPVDLGDMIGRHSEVLTFYNEFVNNYRQNMNKLEDLRRNPDFNAFVDGVQKSLGSRLRLEDFLALPAVKISATSSLIEQLIAVLTEQHPNFFLLRDFHQRLAPIANQATALKSQMEARSKIVALETSIVKFPKKASFLHDQRMYYRDGVFEMGTKKKSSLCYVVLFTDLMIVCKAPEKKKKDKLASPPTFEEVIAFGPTGCSVEEVGSQGWNLHIDAGKGKFTINCSIHTSSEHSKAEWVKSFKDAFQDFSQKPHLKPPVL